MTALRNFYIVVTKDRAELPGSARTSKKVHCPQAERTATPGLVVHPAWVAHDGSFATDRWVVTHEGTGLQLPRLVEAQDFGMSKTEALDVARRLGEPVELRVDPPDWTGGEWTPEQAAVGRRYRDAVETAERLGKW